MTVDLIMNVLDYGEERMVTNDRIENNNAVEHAV